MIASVEKMPVTLAHCPGVSAVVAALVCLCISGTVGLLPQEAKKADVLIWLNKLEQSSNGQVKYDIYLLSFLSKTDHSAHNLIFFAVKYGFNK